MPRNSSKKARMFVTYSSYEGSQRPYMLAYRDTYRVGAKEARSSGVSGDSS